MFETLGGGLSPGYAGSLFRARTGLWPRVAAGARHRADAAPRPQCGLEQGAVAEPGLLVRSCDSSLSFLLSSRHQRWLCRRPTSIRTTSSIFGGSVTFSLLRNRSVAVSPTGTFWVTTNGGPSRNRRAHAPIRCTSAPNGTMYQSRLLSTIPAVVGPSRIWRTGPWRKSGMRQSETSIMKSLTFESTVSFPAPCTDRLVGGPRGSFSVARPVRSQLGLPGTVGCSV